MVSNYQIEDRNATAQSLNAATTDAQPTRGAVQSQQLSLEQSMIQSHSNSESSSDPPATPPLTTESSRDSAFFNSERSDSHDTPTDSDESGTSSPAKSSSKYATPSGFQTFASPSSAPNAAYCEGLASPSTVGTPSTTASTRHARNIAEDCGMPSARPRGSAGATGIERIAR